MTASDHAQGYGGWQGGDTPEEKASRASAQCAPGKLLPCPFCGGAMEEVTDEDGHYWVHPGRKGMERADCWLCDAWVSDEESGEGSIGEWNTRAAISRSPAETDAINAEQEERRRAFGPFPWEASPAAIEQAPCPRCSFPYEPGAAERYWEGRWRDEKAANERLAALVERLPASLALALSSERERRVLEQHNDVLPIYLYGFDDATEVALASVSIPSTDRSKAIDVEQIEQSQDKPLRFIIVRSATNPNPDIFGKAPPGCESFRVTSTSTEPPIDTFIHAPSFDRAKAIVRSLFAGATFSDEGAFLR